MDCRETQTLLTAFHDGELPAADRARVEEHLRGCPECAARLADLVRVDQAAGVPDPGSAYWDRFNARVMERVEREADGPRVAVLRPKGGWMRQQLRYLIPAAAAAALVFVVVRFGGMYPGAPTPTVPTAGSERAAPVPAKERLASVTREERDRQADRSLPTSRDAAGPVAPTADLPPGAAEDGTPSAMQAERKKTAGTVDRLAEQQGAGKANSASGMRMANEQSAEALPAVSLGESQSKAVPSPLASASARSASPCALARTLAERERFREAEDAQRACLAGNLDAPSRERDLVFLAELLDRQARFADADAVIAEVDRKYPESRPLDLYRQRRSMVQKQPAAVPVTR